MRPHQLHFGAWVIKYPAPAASIGPQRFACRRPVVDSVVPAVSADEAPAGIAGRPTPLVDPPDRIWFPKPFSDVMSALVRGTIVLPIACLLPIVLALSLVAALARPRIAVRFLL